MDVYINGSWCISPFSIQEEPRVNDGGRFVCIEPDYKLIIDARQLRRMSRIMRMGLAAAVKTLENTTIKAPQAIITATGFGCLEDTGNFLVKVCDADNRMMNPTAFIQSIHNTMGGQIALYLKNNCYNNTYTQDVLSFEHALLDAILLFQEGETESVLLGGIDELTDLKHELSSRLFKAQKERTSFCGQGEGSAFFSLSATPSPVKLCTLILSPDEKHEDILEYISDHFATENNTLIFTGKSGGNSDEAYHIAANIPEMADSIHYKKYCGDYSTACSFGVWLANEILQQKITGIVQQEPPQHILIYHAYANRPHTLIHLSAC